MTGIVVGVDGSEGGAAALEWAAREADLHDRPVTAVLAWDWLAQHHSLASETFDLSYREPGGSDRSTVPAMPAAQADQPGQVAGLDTPRPAGEPGRCILVAIGHGRMRALTCELLERSCGCNVAGVATGGQRLAEAMHGFHPDLVVLDTGQFPDGWRAALSRFPSERVIVIGPEPSDAYRAAALAGGAGGWVARDRVGEDLGAEVCRVLSLAAPPPRRGAHSGGSLPSVVDRSTAPRGARMAAPAWPATLAVAPRAEEEQ